MSKHLSLTRDQVRAFDNKAINEWGVPGVVLMENAGRNAASVALAMLSDPAKDSVAILCGPGNNGGDGFVVARHLARARVRTKVYLAVDSDRLKGDARVNYDIWGRIGGALESVTSPEQIDNAAIEWAGCALIVDALLGTGFSGRVRPPFDRIIGAVNDCQGPRVLALDVPSGLDCDTGAPGSATIRAHTTVTFVARKVGFDAPGAAEYTGRVVVADIGVPYQ